MIEEGEVGWTEDERRRLGREQGGGGVEGEGECFHPGVGGRREGECFHPVPSLIASLPVLECHLST